VIDVIDDGTSYWVHDRSQPRAGLVDKTRLDAVLAANRDKLVKKPAPPTPAPKPGAGSGVGGSMPGAPGMPPMPPGAPPASGW
jgi:hypothetical protein